MLAKKTSKNQITLPKRIVEQFPDVDYFEVRAEDGHIILEPARPGEAREVRKKLAELAVHESDVDAAIAWARSRS